MPIFGARGPPAPTCEECWDEDTPSPFTDAGASRNLAQHANKSEFDPKSVADKKSNDGSDSGYSSKAGTSDDMSTVSMKKGADLKLNTSIERERAPYTFAPRPEDARTASPTKMKSVKIEKTPKHVPSRPPPGQYWPLDPYGYPIQFIEREIPRPATVAPTQPQKVAKPHTSKHKAKEEGDERPAHPRRRSSSTSKRERPMTMYGGLAQYGYQPAVADFQQFQMSAQGWQTPPNAPYGHFPYPYPPPTPVSAGYSHPPGFFDMSSPVQYTHPPEPFYQEPRSTPRDESNARPRSSKRDSSSKRTSTSQTRQRSSTKSKTSPDADTVLMPPPPRPDAARSIPRKAPTEYPVATSRRLSVFTDDSDAREVQNFVARERVPRQTGPSAYPGAEIQGRPRATRKSQSYSVPSGTIQVASSREIPRRRTDPYEQKVANAEDHIAKINRQKEADMAALLAKLKVHEESESESEEEEEEEDIQSHLQEEANYQAFLAQMKRNSQNTRRRPSELDELLQMKLQRGMEPDNLVPRPNRLSMKPSLTAETLKIIEKQTGMSDAGSTRSKHSSRESAAGRTRSGTTVTSGSRMMNITTENGISLSIPADLAGDIPVEFLVGNIRLSMNREDPVMRNLKQIEQTPSEISHTSRRSLTNESVTSVPKYRDEPQLSARQKHSSYSSKKSSRAPSTTRPDKRAEVRSIDYSLMEPESFYQLEY